MMYDVRDYGAVGDGRTNDGAAIQRAVDACAAAGGGRVVLPGGAVYCSGSIRLKSGVDFHLEGGAVLKASGDLRDYQSVGPDGEPVSAAEAGGTVQTEAGGVPSYVNCEYHGRPRQYFIYALHGENIRITGEGAIDGSEEIYYGEVNRYHIEGSFYPRIPMIFTEDIRHLTVKDVTLTRCGFWTLHMAGCYDVGIDGIRILNNLKMANCDGIDPDHCEQVRITNCHIECADDCIVLKNTLDYEKYGPCRDILISGCTLISTSSAVKFGTESESDFRNVVIENCSISRTNRGISIQLRDKGNVENVLVSNVNIETRRFSDQWWGSAEPIYVTAFDRKEGVTAGRIRNIRFRDISCTGENGIFICGGGDHWIEDISLEGIRVCLKKTSKWPVETYDVRPCKTDGILHVRPYGLYMDQARKIRLSDVRICIDESMEGLTAGECYIGKAEQIIGEVNHRADC